MDQIYLKNYFQSKTEEEVQGLQTYAFCVVMIILNILNEKFVMSWARFILKLYKAFQTALCKLPWLIKPRLNFSVNVSFKFLYNFTRQLKKLKFVMVMVKSFDKYYYLYGLHILVTFLFFHNWDSSIFNIKVL